MSHQSLVKDELLVFSGGSKGGHEGRDPGSKFFQFHAVFWENLAKSYVGAPLEGWRPHLGEILDPPLVFTLC